MRLVELECPNCGAMLQVDKELKECACNYCGHVFVLDNESDQKETVSDEEWISQPEVINDPNPYRGRISGMSIAAFILSCLGCVGPVGMILGIIDLSKKDGRRKGLSIAALAIGAVMAIVSLSALSSGTQNGKINTKVTVNSSGNKTDSDISIGDEFGNKTITGVVMEADLDYKDYNVLWTKPKDDQKAIYLRIKMTNNSEKSNYVSVGDFKCYVDNISTNSEMITGGDEDYNANIDPGRSAILGALYIIPKDAKDIELEYNPIGEASERVIIKIQ